MFGAFVAKCGPADMRQPNHDVTRSIMAERLVPERLAPERKPGSALAASLHDLNNLLTVIAAGLGSVRDRARGDPDIVSELDILEDATHRAVALAHAASLSPGGTPVQAGPLDLTATLEALAPLVRHMLGPQIETVFAPGPDLRAEVDSLDLERVMLNLASNARDAMPQGGRFTLGARRVNVALPLSCGGVDLPPGDYIVVEAADTGCGISPNLLPHVLQPGVTTKVAREGHGLGLASVDEIVRQSGGAVTIESLPCQGTTVLLHLRAAAPARDQSFTSSAGGRLLLLVEDEAALRRLATRKLEREGWLVLAAESAEDAIALLESRHISPDLVVADIALPGMTGVALIEVLRMRQPNLPALLTSGYPGEGRDAGLRCLLKPYGLETLAQVCAECVAAS